MGSSYSGTEFIADLVLIQSLLSDKRMAVTTGSDWIGSQLMFVYKSDTCGSGNKRILNENECKCKVDRHIYRNSWMEKCFIIGLNTCYNFLCGPLD